MKNSRGKIIEKIYKKLWSYRKNKNCGKFNRKIGVKKFEGKIVKNNWKIEK